MVLKDENKARKWRVQLTYKDPVTGKSARKQKRGFDTKKEAQEWERNFLNSLSPTSDITFANLVEAYLDDIEKRIRTTTLSSKNIMINKHLLPFFGDIKIKDITPLIVRRWQKEILEKNYSPTYTKILNNQINGILNYAVSYYGLDKNPAKTAGSIGKSKAEEMLFWTLDQFNEFIIAVDNTLHRLMFLLLFYGGMRKGEMLALTKSDFNFVENTIRINKTYVVVHGVEYIHPPKTKNSIRTITMPKRIMDLAKDTLSTLYGPGDNDRVFNHKPNYPGRMMDKYIKRTSLHRIRVHDLRHSHASLMISMDINIMTLADRLGHKDVKTTWNTYGHLYPNKRTEIIDRLNYAIFTPDQNNQ